MIFIYSCKSSKVLNTNSMFNLFQYKTTMAGEISDKNKSIPVNKAQKFILVVNYDEEVEADYDGNFGVVFLKTKGINDYTPICILSQNIIPTVYLQQYVDFLLPDVLTHLSTEDATMFITKEDSDGLSERYCSVSKKYIPKQINPRTERSNKFHME